MADCLKPVRCSSGNPSVDILRAEGKQGISQYLITLLLRQYYMKLIENYNYIWEKMFVFCNKNQIA